MDQQSLLPGSPDPEHRPGSGEERLDGGTGDGSPRDGRSRKGRSSKKRGGGGGRGGGRTKRKSVQRGRLKVHDPFELVRWLALSQPDPRKALAELVQNSLDAGATQIEIVRFRKKGLACLEIRDDGEGVIPELPGDEALKYLATHIGHSRKRSLTPRERLELMTQGQYGIGLLGFWSLGQRLEIEAWPEPDVREEGERPFRLTLHRDRREYQIEPIRVRTSRKRKGKVGLDGTAQPKSTVQPKTIVRVVGLHSDALPVLTARRATAYLGKELRGQLLARETEISVRDRMARGRSPRRLRVEARSYSGTPIVVARVEIDGHPPAELDLYLAEGVRQATPVALYSAGTLVAESFSELAGLGLDCRPWTDSRLTGAIEFPSLVIAPGSRRGVVPSEASAALKHALDAVAVRVQFALDQEDERQSEELDRSLVRSLQKAFRGLGERLNRFALLPVQSGHDGIGDGASVGQGEPAGPMPGAVVEGSAGTEFDDVLDDGLDTQRDSSPGFTSSHAPEIEEVPTGPLHAVEVKPSKVIITGGSARIVRGRAVDRDGRDVGGRVDYLWRLLDVDGSIEELPSLGSKIRLHADAVSPEDAPLLGRLRVTACQDDRRAAIEVPVEVRAPRESRDGREGVPEPELVSEGGADWRSRMVGDRWQVNSAHPSYLAVVDRPALKLRYLALLFAKEVVVMNHRDPKLIEPLEEMADLFGYADRNLAR